MRRIENSASVVVTFLMVDATDDETAEVGLTPVPVVKVSKNGGTFATSTNAATEMSDGWYKVTLTTTETNTDGTISMFATATGCDIWRTQMYVATTAATVTIVQPSQAILNSIAASVWRLTAANIEASAFGDALIFRSPYGLLSKVVNKVAATDATTLTIYKANDTTALGTQTMTTTTDSVRITSLDTV